MGLTDEVPNWLKYSLRFIGWALALSLIGSIGYGIVRARLVYNVIDCSAGTKRVAVGQSLPHAKSLAACLDDKNGILENFMMRSIHRTLNAMPNNPAEFVGVWNSSQPRCNYRFLLKPDGQFLARPGACSISSNTYRGYWGVHENSMIWLAEEDPLWPPDINTMDYVDRDLFLLTEGDGTRTKFVRALDATEEEKLLLLAAAPKPVPKEATPEPSAATPKPRAPTRAPISELSTWSEEQAKGTRAQLDSERFAKLNLGREPDWTPYISGALLEELRVILAARGCQNSEFSLYQKSDRAVRVLVGDYCRTDGVPQEYPLVIVIGDNGLREIDLSRHGFMYESGRIEAYTDVNRNGRVEIWLTGDICECDGEDEAKARQECDCTGHVVVEEPAAP